MTEQPAEPDHHFERVVDELAVRFAGVHERDMVVRVVDDARHELEAHARVTSYLPVLTLKTARARLATAALARPVIGVV